VIRVGPAGWSYPDWEGVVYPRPKPRGFHPLAHLLNFVDCVEVNSSFYAIPRVDLAARWVGLAGEREGFRFLVKLHQGFTHAPPLPEEAFGKLVQAFLEGVEPLAHSGKLGALLIQFPVSFTHTREGERRLDRLSEVLGHLPLAIELRHRSWFGSQVLAGLRRRRMSLLHLDLPHSSSHPPPWFETTGPIGYLRLHGRNAENWFARGVGRDERYDYLYTPSEIDEMVEKARRLATEHDQTYVITNNHFQGQAVVNALEIRARLTGRAPIAPAQLVERYPRLREITRIFGQQSLF
jgi:uncharacterized protein YecE (DUF72 family)